MEKIFYFTAVVTYTDGTIAYYSGYVVSNNSLFNIDAAETQSNDYAPTRYNKFDKQKPTSVSIVHHFETNKISYEKWKEKMEF